MTLKIKSSSRPRKKVLLIALLLTGWFAPSVLLPSLLAADEQKVIVLGIDGMDPRFLRQFMNEGRMPHFEKLAQTGSFSELQTTMPPLSPVAWSTFITGMEPGGHGIYDFLHRDPNTMEPVEAMYEVGTPGNSIELGSWVVPLSGDELKLKRQGVAFWELLEQAGIETTIFRMPVNFPPVETSGQSFSGMGTPDILGTHGTFAFYTDYPPANSNNMTGGVVHLVEVINNRVTGQLTGPPNPFRRFPVEATQSRRQARETIYQNPDLAVDFEVFVDPETPTAKLIVQDQEYVLNEGEWTEWVNVDFEAVPLIANVSAIARFYLQEVRPDFKLYVTPLQISPSNPAMPISTPDDWSSHISNELGHFYTQELPEDTKAFQEGIFSGREFWEQSQFVYKEQRRALDYMLESFESGLLFFYFSSVDQGMHMLYHYMDQDHPLHEKDELLVNGARTLYEEMDEALGRVLETIDESTTVVVMSDHGFSPFYWGVNLNSWLLEKGYVTLKNPSRQGELPLFLNVDWSQTSAYAVGLQGLYVNLKGREINGIISSGNEYDDLLNKLETDLLEMWDSRTEKAPVRLVFRPRDEWQGDHIDSAPDLIIGYEWGYRSSWDNPLGQFPQEVFVDNDETWSGDHSIDYRLVPGIFLSNKKINLETPALYDLTVSVLDEFNVNPLAEMVGRDALED